MMKTRIKLLTLIVTFVINFAASAQKTQYSLVDHIGKYSNKNCSFFEVTGDMFQLLSQDERIKGELKDYISNINYLVYVECPSNYNHFYQEFMQNTNLEDYSILMRSKDRNENMVFYRKVGKEWKEYLMVYDQGLQYVVTKLDLRSLSDMAKVMELAGSLGAR